MYVEQIFAEHVVPVALAMVPRFLFQPNYVRRPRTTVHRNFLEELWFLILDCSNLIELNTFKIRLMESSRSGPSSNPKNSWRVNSCTHVRIGYFARQYPVASSEYVQKMPGSYFSPCKWKWLCDSSKIITNCNCCNIILHLTTFCLLSKC